MNIKKIDFTWIFLFCYFLELFAFPDLWVLMGGVAICTALYCKQKTLRLDFSVCLLILTVFMYFCIDDGLQSTISQSFVYIFPITFIMAHYLSVDVKNNGYDDNEMLKLLMVMVIGITIHGVLNSYMWLKEQWMYGNLRVWQDFWSKKYKYAAMQNIYYLPVMSIAFPMLILKRNKKIVDVLFMLISLGFFLYISLASQSRLPVIMFPIIVCAQIMMYILLERKRLIEKLNMKRVAVILGIAIAMLVLGGVLFIKSSIGQNFLSIMSRDGGILNNVRFKIQRQAISELFLYPFGGRKMDFSGYSHAHNAWIDIADAAGVIPFFAFVLYTLMSITEMIKLLKLSSISIKVKISFVGIFLAYALFFMIDSAFESYDRCIVPWIFVQGLIHGYTLKEKEKCKYSS